MGRQNIEQSKHKTEDKTRNIYLINHENFFSININFKNTKDIHNLNKQNPPQLDSPF